MRCISGLAKRVLAGIFALQLMCPQLSLAAVSGQVGGSGFHYKMSGFLNANYGLRKQNNMYDQNMLTSGSKNSAAVGYATVGLSVWTKSSSGAEYGASVSITPTTNIDGENSYLYVNNKYGQFSIGSRSTVASALASSCYDVMVGGAGAWGDFAILNPATNTSGPNGDSVSTAQTNGTWAHKFTTLDNNSLYAIDSYGDPKTFDLPSGDFESNGEAARGVTYYSPKFSGVQFGLSYMPSLNNSATSGNYIMSNFKSRIILAPTSDNAAAIGAYFVDFSVKNLISAAVKVEHSFRKGLDAYLSLAYEGGKVLANTVTGLDSAAGAVSSVSAAGATVVNANDLLPSSAKAVANSATYFSNAYKFSNISSYNIGGGVKYDKFALSASYLSLGSAFTSSTLDSGHSRSGRITTAAVKYSVNDKFAVSLGGMFSQTYRARITTFILDAEYVVAHGFTVYGEVARFNRRNILKVVPDKTPVAAADIVDYVTKGRGTVYVVGSKIAF